MVSVPAVRHSAASTRAGSAGKGAGSWGFDNIWTQKPWACPDEVRRRRRCRRSRDRGGTPPRHYAAGGTPTRLRGRMAQLTGPLDGLRVVEIADEISGPYCGKLFADLGADVTKVEGP